MKTTLRRVVCLIMALCLFSAMTTAFARSSLTLSAYSAGCVAESGGKIAIWIDVTGTYPHMDKIGSDAIYLYESTDNVRYTRVAVFKPKDYPSMLTTNTISYYEDVVTYQGVPGRYYSATVYCYAEKDGVSDSKPYETATVRAIR
ncbi:MAG: hypothetical protein SPL18_05755 [Oscillospiraceae bacterium]|nr:hypothetical protein [Oscillospiraceae bacterium]